MNLCFNNQNAKSQKMGVIATQLLKALDPLVEPLHMQLMKACCCCDMFGRSHAKATTLCFEENINTFLGYFLGQYQFYGLQWFNFIQFFLFS